MKKHGAAVAKKCGTEAFSTASSYSDFNAKRGACLSRHWKAIYAGKPIRSAGKGKKSTRARKRANVRRGRGKRS